MERFLKRPLPPETAPPSAAKRTPSSLPDTTTGTGSKFADCPICGRSVPLSLINEHIDSGCSAAVASTPARPYLPTPPALPQPPPPTPSSTSDWGSLRPPSSADVMGRGRAKGLAAPKPPLSHLVVLDFEWTADNRSKMKPCSEITQFPSVIVRLEGRSSHVVDEFDTFVRPVLNPTLTQFSIDLTAITQADVDAAPILETVMPRYVEWLRSHKLVDADGRRIGHWCLSTWSDADIGGQLSAECRHKGLAVPACFDSWVDLKVCYRRHYKMAPKGGLRTCVERLGIPWEGRAHNGLVDSRNTASIALHMAKGDGMFGPAFVFARPTRGLDANGFAYGSRGSKEARKQTG